MKLNENICVDRRRCAFLDDTTCCKILNVTYENSGDCKFAKSNLKNRPYVDIVKAHEEYLKHPPKNGTDILLDEWDKVTASLRELIIERNYPEEWERLKGGDA